jgi:DMSO/TMAO reductase YedYZ molybdopterin-dependent catalytic subunit
MALDDDTFPTQDRLSRRRLLQLAAAGIPVMAGLGRFSPPAWGQAAPPILKPLPPEWFIPLGTNAEMRWDTAAGLPYTTPNERFFVRNHTATPIIDPVAYRLQVFGSGLRNPDGVSLSLRDLKRLPSRSVTAFIECAGNGRSFFASQQGTPAPGSQWKLGAIGVARWRGVPLGEVLERAGLTRRAVDVMPEGLDAVVADQGHVRRPFPVEKALDDVLLAYEMNGAPLPADHGAPLRVIVPGWVGIANIKWVGRIEVADHPLASAWNTTQYRLTGPTYPVDQPPLTIQGIKSVFELPIGAQLTAGREQVLTGRSWSGSAPVGRVEVSVDGGRHFSAAQLHGPNLANAWVRWRFPFRPRTPGAFELQARATDLAHRTQPPAVPFNAAGYLFEAIVKHPVQAV